jgi:PTH1 family peptidyl-tRNA hydrolase
MSGTCRQLQKLPVEGDALRIIVGLGNPGAEHAHTRHNAGFQCVERLARAHGLKFDATRFESNLAAGSVCGVNVVLAKPLTYMNLCGRAVASLVRYHRLNLSRLLVVYDDLDLSLGTIRLRATGGSGGHKGMRSIIRSLTASDFPRLRVGIGRSPVEDPSDYVLSVFTEDERMSMDAAYTRAAQAMECYLSRGIDAAMNEFNE